ncbi:MAG: TolC family protein [Candidatus Palauibacterales bacterium]|nr:TolC family protein [Candidatus Palauibacterales bacterium]
MTEHRDTEARGRAGSLRLRGLLAAVLTAALIPLVPQAAAAQQQATGDAAGQGTLRLSVEDAVRRAVTENEQVLMARADAARTRGIVKETRAQSLPDLRLNMGYTRNLQSPVIFFNQGGQTQQIQIGDQNEMAASLSFEQPLIDFSLGPARRAARLSQSATAAQVEAARTDVALSTRSTYYRVLLDRELVRVQEQALEQAQARLKQVRSFYEAGTGSEFDVLTAQVEVDNIRPQLIQARNRLELNRNRLKRVVGVPLEREVALTDSLSRPPESEVPPLDSAVEVARQNRADLESQRVRVNLQEANVDAQEGEALPALSLSASFSRRASSADIIPPERDFSQTAGASLNVSLPLFDGMARAGRVQQAKAEADRERYRLQQLEEQVRLDVQQARQNLQSAREQIRASEANVERSERALEIAQTRFRNGLSTQVELNDAELAVTRARSNYAQALHDYYVARAQLEAAQGQR